jgi:hypothetical protein
MSGWICEYCGERCQPGDYTCECRLEAEDREILRRKIIISKLDHLSPRERRERFFRLEECHGQ